MKQQLFLFLLLIIWLGACSPAVESVTQPAVATAVMATNVATATIEPTTVAPIPEIDPYSLARQILEQTNLPASATWQVALCEGGAAMLCISNGTENVGFAELILYPLSGYDADHPVRLAASQQPADPIEYTVEDEAVISQALSTLADEYLEVIRTDRVTTFPNDTFTPLPMESVKMGALPALAFGFVRTNEAGDLQERYLNVNAFDSRFIYLLSINYDPANVSSFTSDTAVTEFTPGFYDIAARLPIQQPAAFTLPDLIPGMSLSGYFPQEVSWSLDADLPQAATAVAVLSQPAQIEPLTAEQAVVMAQKYGFDEPLYVEYRTGFTLEEMKEFGMFVAFAGSRTLSFAGRPFTYNDAAHQEGILNFPFTQAVPIAEQFLKENGWLTYPYETAESIQGEGVLFLPVVEGVLLTTPAYAVRVAGDGHIATVFIYPVDNLSEVGNYPILTAEMAWEQVQADPNQSGIFYQIDAPALETAVTYPPTYSHLPAPGKSGTVFNNIWVYQPLAGDGPPIIVSNNYFRINGDPAILEELAAETDYLVKLTGSVEELSPGLQTLQLTDWELVPDAGGLPMFFGQIEYEDGQTFLVDSANRTTYLLPEAPTVLPTDRETIVAGLPEIVDGVQILNWQEITPYPSQAETTLPTPAAPMQAVTVDSVKLVYLQMSAHVSGLADHLFFPVWQFVGTADNGERVTMWVTAVIPE